MRLLRLYDARAGRVVDARPAGRLLRVSVAGLDPAGPRVRDLRALLTGDLIRRLAELHRRRHPRRPASVRGER